MDISNVDEANIPETCRDLSKKMVQMLIDHENLKSSNKIQTKCNYIVKNQHYKLRELEKEMSDIKSHNEDLIKQYEHSFGSINEVLSQDDKVEVTIEAHLDEALDAINECRKAGSENEKCFILRKMEFDMFEKTEHLKKTFENLLERRAKLEQRKTELYLETNNKEKNLTKLKQLKEELQILKETKHVEVIEEMSKQNNDLRIKNKLLAESIANKKEMFGKMTTELENLQIKLATKKETQTKADEKFKEKLTTFSKYLSEKRTEQDAQFEKEIQVKKDEIKRIEEQNINLQKSLDLKLQRRKIIAKKIAEIKAKRWKKKNNAEKIKNKSIKDDEKRANIKLVKDYIEKNNKYRKSLTANQNKPPENEDKEFKKPLTRKLKRKLPVGGTQVSEPKLSDDSNKDNLETSSVLSISTIGPMSFTTSSNQNELDTTKKTL